MIELNQVVKICIAAVVLLASCSAFAQNISVQVGSDLAPISSVPLGTQGACMSGFDEDLQRSACVSRVSIAVNLPTLFEEFIHVECRLSSIQNSRIWDVHCEYPLLNTEEPPRTAVIEEIGGIKP